MSSVFYRWGARKDESRITFDGTHISVFDLKREIILSNKMGNGKDFDIGVFDNVTGEEFKDDNHQIPRSSSLIARRFPSSIKGRGNAQDYIVGTAAADALKNDHRIESHAREALLQKQKQQALRNSGALYGSTTKRFDGKDEKEAGVPVSTGDADEDARIQAMFAQNADQWEQMQEDMSLQSRGSGGNRGRGRPPGVGGAGGGRGGGAAGAGAGRFDYSMPTDKEPPTGYICYRCGHRGHWIQDCPNNDDPQAQEQKRYVRVTGIPRSFLKTVETPVGNEGSSAGAMLTADGGFVQAMPDKRQWQKVVGAKPRTMTPNEVRETQPSDPDLACPICKKVIWEAVKTPCCSTSYCEECVTNWLMDHEFVCESCESKVGSLEELVIDEELRERVGGYIETEIARSRKEKEEEDEQAGRVGGEREQQAAGEGEGAVEPEGQGAQGESGQEGKGGDKPVVDAPIEDVKSGDTANSILDPAKMQEMLNPQTMQLYLSQISKMMANPKISPQGKALLQTQLQMVQTAVMQTQVMLANSGQGMGAGMNAGMNVNPMGMGMNDMMGMVMAMSGPMGMGMGMGGMGGMDMGMGMGMGMNGMNGMGMGMGGMNGNGMGMGMGMNNNNMNIGNNGMGMNMNNGNMGMNMGMGNMGPADHMGGNGNMGMGQGMNMGPGMGMGMGMNQGGPGMGMGMGHMNNGGGGGFRGGGRGGMPFRGGGGGGFRGRGGGGGGGVGVRSGIPIPQVRPPKRGMDGDDGMGGAVGGGGVDKQQRVF